MNYKVFKHQQWTLLFLLIFGLVFFFLFQLEIFLQGDLWGFPTLFWALWAIGIATAHQIYVWLSWRFEIYHHLFTQALGKYAFPLYEAGFFVLFFGRIILTFVVARSNALTLPLPFFLRLLIVVVLAFPMGYTFYSVLRYFGIHRAAGADHFLSEYKKKPFEKRGIYRYSNNAMYTYALFILWVPGLIFGSLTALLIALFNHLYVWVHYYTLEKPDFELIYGTSQPANEN